MDRRDSAVLGCSLPHYHYHHHLLQDPFSPSSPPNPLPKPKPGSHLSPPNANAQDTESEANVTADNSDAPAKPNERLVEETIDKIDGKHHGGKGELRVSLRGRASSRQAASVDESLDFALGRATLSIASTLCEPEAWGSFG